MKEVGFSYQELMWEVPWGIILRILADMPRQVKEKTNKTKNQTLTEQTAKDFAEHIKHLNSKIKR
ncbi:hypothetical protein AB406_0376 [Riemerella anatipestifer]|uniref:Uncharacterized protein n=1 Tax=Riemerella anatipestifer TaxID=34085 RepID=A0A1S7DQE5_RIEAN|nr:hypothetical protein AB406_0376 [Riemerella anatipestifer]